MIQLGYHVSHEHFSPSELQKLVVLAKELGFDFTESSDHFYIWNEAQGQSGFVWSWRGAALSRKSNPMGAVNCPCHRYHPVIIAQAVATLFETSQTDFGLRQAAGNC